MKSETKTKKFLLEEIEKLKSENEKLKLTYKKLLTSQEMIDEFNSAIVSHTLTFKGKEAEHVMADDITGRKQTEEALRLSEIRFKGVINSMQDLVYTLDKEQKITGLFGQWSEMYGLTEELLLGKKLTEFLSPAETEVNEAANTRALNGEAVKFEWSLNRNEDRFQFESSLTPLFLPGDETTGNNNEIIGIVGVAREITERKRTELKIRESEERYRKLFDFSPEPIYIHKNGKMLFANSAGYKLLGAEKPEQLIGVNIMEFVHTDYQELVKERMTRLAKGADQLPVVEIKLVGLDGKIIDAEVSTISFSYQGELSVQVVVRDITERKIAGEALRASEERYRLFIENSSEGISRMEIDPPMPLELSTREKAEYYLDHAYLAECNTAFAKMYGFDNPEQLIGRRLNDFWVGSRESIIQEAMPWFEKGIRTVDQETIEKDRYGNTVYFLNNSTSLIKDNKIYQVWGSQRDVTERKKAERQIQLQALLLDSANDAIFLIDCEGRIHYANEFAFKSHGYSLGEILSMKIQDLDVGESLELAPERINGIFENGFGSFEVTHRRKDGSTFTSEVSAQIIRIEDEDYILAINRDLTERKKAEEALKESEERYRNLIHYSPDSIAVHCNGRLIFLNPAAVKLIGAQSADELINKPVIDLVHPDYREFAINRITQVLKTNVPAPPAEEKLIKLDGTVIDVEITSVPMNYGGQKALQVIIRDISERKKAEVELRKLSRAVEQSPAVIMITDTKGSIEYVNPKFTDVTGYTFKKVIGKNPKILKSGGQSEKFYKNIYDTLLSGNEWQGEFLNKKKSGELYWESASISPIKNEIGGITHFLAVKEDITERKKIQEELVRSKEEAEEASKLKSSLLANMSHEFRTPLNGILGFSQLLKDEITNLDHIDMLEKIIQSGKRLMNTLNSVLTISELENNHYLISRSEIDLTLFCREIKTLYNKAVISKNLDFKLDIKDEIFSVITDENVLTKVMSCIIENAIKYTHRGEIKIELKHATEKNGERYALINVADTGIGIRTEDQKLIFKEFKQLSEGYRRDFEGLGLGLTLANKMVKLIGGKITVQSEFGKGSIFTLMLPIEVQSETEIIPTEQIFVEKEIINDSAIRNRNELAQVLLVEDNPLNIEVVQRFLSKFCVVSFARDGLTAIEMSKKDDYSLIMIDINLGQGMDGLQVLEEIKKQDGYQNKPIVALTGYASEANKREFLAQGFTHYLAKPFEKRELIKLIISILKLK